MNKLLISLLLIFILSLCLFTACNDDDVIVEGTPIESSEAETSTESAHTAAQSKNGENNGENENSNGRGDNGGDIGDNGGSNEDDEKNWTGQY